DAVLAGGAAAQGDACFQDLAPRGQHTRDLGGNTLVEQQDGMDVAVTGVEDVADADAMTLGRTRDGAHDVGYLRARHHAVLSAVAGSEAADGAERTFARLPERGALGVVTRETQLARVVRAAH